MFDHEFEKKVQQKMDELRLRPSDAVWGNVERDLRRDKRRRRVILWLPLMGILLSAGGYFIFKAPNKPGNESLVKTAPAEKTSAPTVPAATAPSKAAESKTISKPVAETATITKPSSTKNTDNPSSQNSTPTEIKTSLKKETVVADKKLQPGRLTKLPRQKPSAGKNQERIVKENREPKTKSTDKNITDNKSLQKDVKSREEKETPKTTVDSNAIVSNETAPEKTDSSAVAVTTKDSSNKKSTPPAVVKNTQKKKQPSTNKWQWGVTANAGMANISEGNLFNVLRSVRVYDLAGAVPQYNGIPPVPDPEPSAISPGPSFTVGGFIQRTVSKRLSLSAGLQYSYFSVHTRVGKRVDSAVAVNYGAFYSQVASNYYRADNMMQDYTNRYHFIELPVTASYRVIRSKKFPLVLDVGMSFSRLLSTNALHYDGISRVYYENDDFFKRTQLSLNGGLNFGLLQNSKHPLWIGPNLRYFTTGLIKKEVSASGGEQHIWSFGLNAKMLLKK